MTYQDVEIGGIEKSHSRRFLCVSEKNDRTTEKSCNIKNAVQVLSVTLKSHRCSSTTVTLMDLLKI